MSYIDHSNVIDRSNLDESGGNCDGSPWARRQIPRASIAFGRGWS